MPGTAPKSLHYFVSAGSFAPIACHGDSGILPPSGLKFRMTQRPLVMKFLETLAWCPTCHRQMRLCGAELFGGGRDLYTFECSPCASIEVRDGDMRRVTDAEKFH